MTILAIESSCDETAVAILEERNGKFKLRANLISSQVKVHAKYGGVVPEVAARLHIERILPLVDLALSEAKVTMRKIDAIAVTAGPGLISSLMIGVETAKALAYCYNKPLIKVNHIEGHLLSAELEGAKIKFPAVGLVVSGGHAQLIHMKNYLNYKLIGGTRDDAAGEAFDKAAKILGLGYPGGPAIAKEASKITDNELSIALPRPMIDSPDFEMSFSGLKTSVLYTWQKLQQEYVGESLDLKRSAMAREFQQAVIDVLVKKTIKAAEKLKAKTIILGGGVSANRELRTQLEFQVRKHLPNALFLCPEIKNTGDNAAMIALAGFYHANQGKFVKDIYKLRAEPNWELV